VGAGNLGRALASSEWFEGGAFRLAAAFDCDASQVGLRVGPLTVGPLEAAPAWIGVHGVKVAILAVRRCDAQEAADLLVAAGVQVILNYTPRVLRVPPGVRAVQFDPVAALEETAWHLEDRAPAYPAGPMPGYSVAYTGRPSPAAPRFETVASG
jgi:redox-sensing transcriptional repressor